MRRGFTLVELSIVLVIIGLLIGGILVARSMIETAKIQNIVREIQQFDVAVSNFQTKYGDLPGDSRHFGCVDNANGSVCGDGEITDIYDSSQTWNNEIANFWVQLQQGGFTYQNKTFTATVPPGMSNGQLDTSSQNPNIPAIDGSVKGGVLASYCGTSEAVNCWTIADFKTPENSGYVFRRPPTFTVAMALAIDTKFDDGLPYEGSVQNWVTYVSGELDTQTNASACTNYSPKYNLSSAGNVCYLAFGMLSPGRTIRMI